MLAIGDPLQAAAELAGAYGVEPVRALAMWERFGRAALTWPEGLPVFVTSRSGAAGDPAGWNAAVTSFLSRLGLSSLRPPLASLARLFGPPETDEQPEKDEGLLLASQQQLASLLEQLARRPRRSSTLPRPSPSRPG